MVHCICAGFSNRELADRFQFPMRTLQHIRKKLEDSDYDVEAVVARKDHEIDLEKPSYRRSREFVELVEKRVEEDPSISMRALARELHVSNSTIQTPLTAI